MCNLFLFSFFFAPPLATVHFSTPNHFHFLERVRWWKKNFLIYLHVLRFCRRVPSFVSSRFNASLRLFFAVFVSMRDQISRIWKCWERKKCGKKFASHLLGFFRARYGNGGWKVDAFRAFAVFFSVRGFEDTLHSSSFFDFFWQLLGTFSGFVFTFYSMLFNSLSHSAVAYMFETKMEKFGIFTTQQSKSI